jgi:sugar lactone lactonase YvrE
VATARFNFPRGVAVDGTTVYVVESGNATIRKIAAGNVTTFAGVAQSTQLDGTGTAARFGSANAVNVGIALDPAGNIYVADLSNRSIRKVTPAGVVTTLAGSGNFISPIGIAFDPVNNVLRVVENIGVEISPGQTPGRIRTVTLGGVVTTLVSPPAVVAPQAIAIDETGLMYVYDAGVIWTITPAGVMTVLAGAQNTSGNVDATGAAARFGNVYGLAVDSTHNVYVADSGNSTIRKITPAGVVTTLAGSGGLAGLADGTGVAARFASLSPRGIAVDAAGTLYVTDTNNNAVRSVTPSGAFGFVRTLAGSNTSQNALDGTGIGARFVTPTGIAIDAAGKLYVMDGGTGLRTGQVAAPGGGCTYGLGASSASFDATGGFGTIAVTATPGCGWSVVNNNAPFVSIIGGSAGVGNGTVAFTVPQNTSGANLWSNIRSGILSIEGQLFTVTQGGCNYVTTPPSVTFPAVGGPASVAVSTPYACTWNTGALPDWLDNFNGGPLFVTGPGALNLEAGPNTSGAPRTFNETVAGLIVPLQQAGLPVRPMTAGSRVTFNLANASAAQWISAALVGGRSYCLQMMPAPTATTSGTPTIAFFPPNSSSPDDQVTGATPRLCGGSDEDFAISLRITQSDSSSRSYRFQLVETTLFTNWFFTGGDYSSFTLLRNTTDQTINGGVLWYSDAGAFAGGQDFQIAPGGVVFFDARTNANVTTGSVQIQHDGPPQGLVGSQTTLSATTGLSFDTIFVDRIKEKGRY